MRTRPLFLLAVCSRTFKQFTYNMRLKLYVITTYSINVIAACERRCVRDDAAVVTGSDVYAAEWRRRFFSVRCKIRTARRSSICYCKRLSADDRKSKLEYCWQTAERFNQSRNRQFSRLVSSRSYKYVMVIQDTRQEIKLLNCTCIADRKNTFRNCEHNKRYIKKFVCLNSEQRRPTVPKKEHNINFESLPYIYYIFA